MKPVHKLNKSPAERLERVGASARPFHWELRSPTTFAVIGLAILMVVLLIVGIVSGYLGLQVVGDYARRIAEWAWPSGQ